MTRKTAASSPEYDVVIGRIGNQICLVRGEKVLLDSDLAALYGVTTKRLNEQVRRNIERFPEDFMFQLNVIEAAALRSQNATLNHARGKHRKYLPYAFTEHGAIMVASVLNSPRAIEVSIYVVRAFVQLRAFLATHRELATKLKSLERKLQGHEQAIAGILGAIQEMMKPPEPRRRGIGFVLDND